MYGLVLLETAMAEPLGEKDTPVPKLLGSVTGSVNFVPKPETDQG
jgi:hypothetical protein